MGKWNEQANNPIANVQVASSGIHHDTNTPVASEFVIQEKGPGGVRVHLGFDEGGNQIFEARN